MSQITVNTTFRHFRQLVLTLSVHSLSVMKMNSFPLNLGKLPNELQNVQRFLRFVLLQFS